MSVETNSDMNLNLKWNPIRKYPIRRIFQVVPSFSEHDAIGTDARMIQELLQANGMETAIFHGDSRSNTHSRPVGEMVDRFMNETVVIYHFSVASHLAYHLAGLPARIWARYHNITPSGFFNREGEGVAHEMCRVGRTQIPFVAAIADLVIADSAYNGAELAPFTKVPIYVQPILRDYSVITSLPDDASLLHAMKSVSDPFLLFVGRVAPNKCQHDLIQLAWLYRQATGKRVRVILAGSFFSRDYRRTIFDFSQALGMQVSEGFDPQADVVVLGSVSDTQLATLYRHSQVFVSMSEHEGFGVPLVESLWFNLPVLAHDSSAVPETLGGAGYMVNKAHWPEVVETLHHLLTTPNVAQERAQEVARRREELSPTTAGQHLLSVIEEHVAWIGERKSLKSTSLQQVKSINTPAPERTTALKLDSALNRI